MRPRAVIEEDPEGNPFHLFSWHFSGYERKKHDAGRCRYIPLNLGEVPDYYQRFLDPVDIAILKTAPMDLWAYQKGVQIDFSRPGRPTDNAFVESFNRTLRDECLNAHWFTTLAEPKALILAWRQQYNESRPHRSLREGTPNESAREYAVRNELRATSTG